MTLGDEQVKTTHEDNILKRSDKCVYVDHADRLLKISKIALLLFLT